MTGDCRVFEFLPAGVLWTENIVFIIQPSEHGVLQFYMITLSRIDSISYVCPFIASTEVYTYF